MIQKISPQDITDLTQQLAAMLESGVSLKEALNLLLLAQEKQSIKKLLQKLQSKMAHGHSFSQSLSEHAQFDSFYCALIEAGESCGTLAKTLPILSAYRQAQAALKKRLKKALIYPSIVLVTALIMCSILLTQVMPQFVVLFKDANAPLPELTQWMIGLSDSLSKHGLSLLGLGVGLYWGVARLQKTSEQLQKRIHFCLYRFPLLKRTLKMLAISRFFQTLAITFKAGLPIVEAMTLSTRVLNHPQLKSSLQKAPEQLMAGLALSQILSRIELCPKTWVQMIKIGENSESLKPMLEHISQQQSALLHDQLDALSRLIEPAIMLLLGALVGTIVLAMYLPIFEMGTAF